MKREPIVFTNYKEHTLTITADRENIPEYSDMTGPYLSMYNYRYRGYTWTNWSDWSQEEPSLKALQGIVENPSWEEYEFSVIVSPGTSFEEMREITEVIGYIPDYFLEKSSGAVNLLHQTDYIEELMTNGYSLTDHKDGSGNYSFGRGVYCLDKDNFDEDATWPKAPNVYAGHYNGEYLRCIDDTCNGLKCGSEEKFQQEIIIPFNEKEIRWDRKAPCPISETTK